MGKVSLVSSNTEIPAQDEAAGHAKHAGVEAIRVIEGMREQLTNDKPLHRRHHIQRKRYLILVLLESEPAREIFPEDDGRDEGCGEGAEEDEGSGLAHPL